MAEPSAHANPGFFGPAPGDRTALIAFTADARREWSADELNHTAARLAAGLDNRGAAPRDRIGLFAPPSAEWVRAALGVLHAGCTVVPIDDRMSDDNLRSVLEDADLAGLLTDQRGEERLEQMEHDLPKLWRLDEPPEAESGSAPAHWENDDTAVLFYTSGTTGPPKGVPLTPDNLAFQWNTIRETNLVRDDDGLLLPLPLHHVYPFVLGLLTPLKLDVPVLLPHALTGRHLARALREGGATVFLAVPRLLETFLHGLWSKATHDGALRAALLDRLLRVARLCRLGGFLFRPLRKRVAPRLRLLVSGGSPLDPELARTLDAMGWRVAVGYGLTETSPLLTLLPPDDRHYDTVGAPVDGVELRLEDREEDEAEILARGPGVCSGYRNRPEKTREAFHNGWFATGDLGRLEGGRLIVEGRASTMLVLENGENVPPEPLEDHFAARDAIREIALLQREGRLVALAVPEADADPDAVRDTVRNAAETLPSTQHVHEVRLASSPLPRTRLGKLRRAEVDEGYNDAGEQDNQEKTGPADPADLSSADCALLRRPRAEPVWNLLADRFEDRPLSPDSRLADELGIDSLEWVEWTMRIERKTGAVLETERIAELETVRDLLEAVSEAPSGEEGGAADPLENPDQVLGDESRDWRRPRSRTRVLLGTPIFYLHKALIRLFFRIHLHGLEHLPEHGPFILCPTHASYLDAPALIARLPFDKLRALYWAGFARLMFRNAFMRGLSRLGQVFPVDPELEPRESLARATLLLQDGKPVVWFPEGERSPDGRLQPLRPGAGRLAAALDVPLIPVVLGGTHRALPPGRVLPRPGRIDIRIGPPVTVDDREPDAVTDALQTALEDLRSKESP